MTSHTARRRKREERRKKLGLPRRPNIEHQDSQEKPEEKTDKSKYKDEQINLRKVFSPLVVESCFQVFFLENDKNRCKFDVLNVSSMPWQAHINTKNPKTHPSRILRFSCGCA